MLFKKKKKRSPSLGCHFNKSYPGLGDECPNQFPKISFTPQRLKKMLKRPDLFEVKPFYRVLCAEVVKPFP